MKTPGKPSSASHSASRSMETPRTAKSEKRVSHAAHSDIVQPNSSQALSKLQLNTMRRETRRMQRARAPYPKGAPTAPMRGVGTGSNKRPEHRRQTLTARLRRGKHLDTMYKSK